MIAGCFVFLVWQNKRQLLEFVVLVINSWFVRTTVIVSFVSFRFVHYRWHCLVVMFFLFHKCSKIRHSNNYKQKIIPTIFSHSLCTFIFPHSHSYLSVFTLSLQFRCCSCHYSCCRSKCKGRWTELGLSVECHFVAIDEWHNKRQRTTTANTERFALQHKKTKKNRNVNVVMNTKCTQTIW